jgi:signal transduction histidine kinase
MARLYRILLEASQAVVRVAEVHRLLQQVTSVVCRMDHYDRVRVTQNRDLILVTAADGGSGQAPPFFWEKHVMEGARPVVNNDLGQGGGHFGEWLSAALYPLRVGGVVWGCLAFYSRSPGVFVPEEASLLQEFARDLEAGLQARDHDSRRDESDRFLSDMANLVPGLFYKLRYHPTTGLEFLYVSPGIDLLLPLSPGEVHNDAGTVFGSLHPADRVKFYRAGIRSQEFLTVFNLEFRLLRPNGTVVWVLATAFPQKLDEGVVWTGLAIDVTPQNKLQVALQREQELLAVILDNIGDGVIAVDETEKLALVNRTAARLLDRPDLIPGTPWTAVEPSLPWDARDQFKPWFRTRADGTVLHLEAHVSDLTDAGFHTRGRVLLLRDMTDRDRIEERLRQSEKLESIGLLAGGIAHDFNNLLTGVFGFIQLARMNADQADRVVAYLDHALGPFQRARTLTQQLLTFAKGGEIAKMPVRVADLIPAILQFTLAGSSVTWDWSAPGVPWTVMANEAQLHQVFENLFLNARQAMPGGGVVRVVLNHLASPGPENRGLEPQEYLQVTVADDGPGIPSDVVSKIFDPFFTTKSGGTGLGLSICFSVIKKHGGTIEVEPSPSGGTLFRLFLPAVPLSPKSATEA